MEVMQWNACKLQWMHDKCTILQWNAWHMHVLCFVCFFLFFEMHDICNIYNVMHDNAVFTMMHDICKMMQWLRLQFSLFSQQGDILGWFSIQNWGVDTPPQPMGLPYRFQAEGTPSGYLNQTLVSEIPNLCVLGMSRSNSSFDRPSWSSRNSPQKQTGGFTRPPKVVWARQTPKELHLQRI